MPNLQVSRTPTSAAPAKPHRWALVVDLNVCTGCGACAVACRAENNVAIAGPKEAARNGTLQWIRIERNWSGAGDDFRVESRPVSCQQCEDAPCEPVCPVLATYTDAEGLSIMVYNRCVGVRYCALNCPYAERYFNWFDYEWSETMELQLNPDVSRRTRGITEKCDFCVQRVLAAERDAKLDGREIRDGDVQPACVQSCPAQALIFGDLNDKDSRIARVWGTPGLETLLGDLGTRPRVRYARRGDVLGARALDPDTEGAA